MLYKLGQFRRKSDTYCLASVIDTDFSNKPSFSSQMAVIERFVFRSAVVALEMGHVAPENIVSKEV